MTLLSRLRSAVFFAKEKTAGRGTRDPAKGKDGGPDKNHDAILAFANTGEVIQAERVLKAGGVPVRVMGPPPALRTGCDMVLVVPLPRAFAAAVLLEKAELPPLRMLPAGEALLNPVSLYNVKDYGDWLMVRAANMKITVEKAGRRIVNVSGGGCPDVPWLAAQLVGKGTEAAPLLKEHGQTLCGYALHLALTELTRLLDGKEAEERQ